MTPERLQEIQERATEFYSEDHTGRAPADAAASDVWELLDYIDLLHEDLRLTRAERDAEKKKRAQQSKGHTAEVLAWDALAVATRADAWDEGYEEGRSDGWHDTRVNTPNPYRKDPK